MPRAALIICTRNRPDDLAQTLESAALQAAGRLVMVVDASDSPLRLQNEAALARLEAAAVHYVPFDGPPSLARQRNAALDALPPEVDVVHFIDDDVTLSPGFFDHLEDCLDDDPALGGVGSRVVQPVPTYGRWRRAFRRLFLLDHPAPGRVLCSGAATTAQVRPFEQLLQVDWLAGCSCTFRRALAERHRCDPRLEGYSLDEDLDLSYRIGQEARLLATPGAVLTHHVSAANRHQAEAMAYAALVHRYWFVQKNLRHPLARPAFWWATLGRLLATSVSRRAEARAARRGLLRAIATIRRCDHPLLR